MTFDGRNLSLPHPAAAVVRRVAELVSLAVVVLLLAIGRAGAAGDAEDLEVTVHVRAALHKDAQLGSLNLNVRTTSGVAYLSGRVPSNELRQKAIQVARLVPGVLEVRTRDLYVGTVRRGRPLLFPVEDGRPTSTRSASPNQLSAVDPSGRGPIASSSPTVTLLAPEAVLAPSRPAEPATLTGNTRPPTSATAIASAIDRLRARDPRFRPIRTEVQGTTVRILTGDAAGDNVMAFAQAIARLPGVQRVAVSNTTSPR